MTVSISLIKRNYWFRTNRSVIKPFFCILRLVTSCIQWNSAVTKFLFSKQTQMTEWLFYYHLYTVGKYKITILLICTPSVANFIILVNQINHGFLFNFTSVLYSNSCPVFCLITISYKQRVQIFLQKFDGIYSSRKEAEKRLQLCFKNAPQGS